MNGLRDLSSGQVRKHLEEFAPRYIDDWKAWLSVKSQENVCAVATEFGRILRRWQACRPNRMRRTKLEGGHAGLYLDDLIARAQEPLGALRAFECCSAIAPSHREALRALWRIFTDLSYLGKARNGHAGVVGISKAVLLLTEGRVGPAFDSKVRGNLKTGKIGTADAWIASLQRVGDDIMQFEKRNKCRLRNVVPRKFAGFHCGRIYDMVFGPRKKQE